MVVRSGKEQATAFKFDQGGRIYLVTTRRLGKTLRPNDAVVQVWRNQTWNDLQTVRTLFPTSGDVDLAILETNERIARPYTVVKSEEVFTTGQRVWLLGGPDPISLPAGMPPKSWPGFERPYINVGTISAISFARSDAFEIHMEGGHSPLSGGPIIYWSPDHRDFEILGVTKRDQVGVGRTPDRKPTQERVMKGYSIDEVVDAISHNPHS
jgi:hypothetical protein